MSRLESSRAAPIALRLFPLAARSAASVRGDGQGVIPERRQGEDQGRERENPSVFEPQSTRCGGRTTAPHPDGKDGERPTEAPTAFRSAEGNDTP